jgi:hypothetical protein
MNPTTIPITIAPEAAERVAELGMEQELEKTLDFLQEEVAGALSVDVQRALPYHAGEETGIVLEVQLDRRRSNLSARRQIRNWMVDALPPAVHSQFLVLTIRSPLPGRDRSLPSAARSATGIPVTNTPEAAQRVAELGMQRELRRVLEHTLRTIPTLKSIEVTLALPYDTADEHGITIVANVAAVSPFVCEGERKWSAWTLGTFPREIWRYFHLCIK